MFFVRVLEHAPLDGVSRVDYIHADGVTLIGTAQGPCVGCLPVRSGPIQAP